MMPGRPHPSSPTQSLLPARVVHLHEPTLISSSWISEVIKSTNTPVSDTLISSSTYAWMNESWPRPSSHWRPTTGTWPTTKRKPRLNERIPTSTVGSRSERCCSSRRILFVRRVHGGHPRRTHGATIFLTETGLRTTNVVTRGMREYSGSQWKWTCASSSTSSCPRYEARAILPLASPPLRRPHGPSPPRKRGSRSRRRPDLRGLPHRIR
jgi:hypothetical protein